MTLLFLPDTTGLDLREQERRWKYALEGRANDYRGTAVHRRVSSSMIFYTHIADLKALQHLSLWEIYVQKQHLQYDADADAKARLEEWQNTYQRERREKGEKGSTWDENASDLSSEVNFGSGRNPYTSLKICFRYLNTFSSKKVPRSRSRICHCWMARPKKKPKLANKGAKIYA